MRIETVDLFARAAKVNPSAAKPLPADVIRKSLEIDETVPSGLRWKVRPRSYFKTDRAWKIFNSRFAGKAAGTRLLKSIYWRVNINGVLYLSHRITWFLANGTDPVRYDIDHIQHDLPFPNTARNLRLATRTENLRNQRKRIDNTSGVSGVVWDKRDQKWKAQIQVNYKTIHLGIFTDIASAIAARKDAEARYFGEFAFSASQKGKMIDSPLG